MPYILSLLVLWCRFAPAFPIPFPTLLRLGIYEIYVQPFPCRLKVIILLDQGRLSDKRCVLELV